jgi:hypothetical protein
MCSSPHRIHAPNQTSNHLATCLLPLNHPPVHTGSSAKHRRIAYGPSQSSRSRSTRFTSTLATNAKHNAVGPYWS